jgi:TorA maturation chaperone TorD
MMVAVASWAWTYGYDYLARAWLGGPFRVHEDALNAWLEGVAQRDSDLSRHIAGIVRSLDDSGELESATREFQDCIALPMPGLYVPPYASFWLDPSKSLWGAVTRQVLSWYNDAGLDWSNHVSPYPSVRAPDHLGIECAFAAELWAGVAGTSYAGGADSSDSLFAVDPVNPVGAVDPVGSSGAGDLVGSVEPTGSLENLRRVFIGEHMSAWVPLYAKELRNRLTSTYWRGMADILQRWVHLNALELLPAARITS